MTSSPRTFRSGGPTPHAFRSAAALAASAACVITLAACGPTEETITPSPSPSSSTTSTTTTASSSSTPTPTSSLRAAPPTNQWSRDNLRGAPGLPPSRYFEPPVSPHSLAPANTRCLSYTPPTGKATDNVITTGLTSCAEANEVIFDFLFGAGREPRSYARVRDWNCRRSSRTDTPEVRCTSRLTTIRAIPRPGVDTASR
ncbi:MAG: hypothetical protein KH384_04480 [Corynebacteriales bacterium]|nr:hypothetical protein [Mycobacteriales bacterium]